jgi:hypothetical protein
LYCAASFEPLTETVASSLFLYVCSVWIRGSVHNDIMLFVCRYISFVLLKAVFPRFGFNVKYSTIVCCVITGKIISVICMTQSQLFSRVTFFSSYPSYACHNHNCLVQTPLFSSVRLDDNLINVLYIYQHGLRTQIGPSLEINAGSTECRPLLTGTSPRERWWSSCGHAG